MKGWTETSLAALAHSSALPPTPARNAPGESQEPSAPEAAQSARSRFRSLRLVWRYAGEKTWRKTAHVVPDPFAAELLASAREGRMTGLTAPIVIPPVIDRTRAEFELRDES